MILVIALPAYIVAAATLASLLDRPHWAAELAVYLGLGLVWIVPLKRVFLGVGQADPDAPDTDEG